MPEYAKRELEFYKRWRIRSAQDKEKNGGNHALMIIKNGVSSFKFKTATKSNFNLVLKHV
jgi:hypothetical protein